MRLLYQHVIPALILLIWLSVILFALWQIDRMLP